MEEAYILACSNGDIKSIESILHKTYRNIYKLDIHLDNEQALKIACKNNKLNVIDYLIKYGEAHNNRFDVYVNDNEIMKIACRNNYIDIVKYLMKYSIKCNKPYNLNEMSTNIIYDACKSNSVILVKYLIKDHEFNFKCNAENIYCQMLIVSCYENSIDVLKYLLYNYTNKLICKKNIDYRYISKYKHDNIDVMKILLEYYDIKNQCINESMYIEILENACRYGNINVVEFIFDYSKKTRQIINMTNNMFNFACISGNVDLVAFFINFEDFRDFESFEDVKHSKNFNKSKIIKIGLIEACVYGHYDTIVYLLDYAAGAHIFDIDWNDLFVNSCRHGSVKLIKFLLDYKYKHGQQINIYYNNNEAFRNICSDGNIELYKFLLKYQNKINNNKFDIYFDNFILLSNACNSSNVELIKFLLYQDINASNKILEYNLIGTSYNNNLLHNICIKGNEQAIKCIIEYCYTYNLYIDLYIDNKYIFGTAFKNYHYYIIKYLIYLTKHNYNKTNKELIVYNINGINNINTFYNEHIKYIIIDFIFKYKELFFIRKCVKQYSTCCCMDKCTYITNNNVICIMDDTRPNFKNNYTLYTV